MTDERVSYGGAPVRCGAITKAGKPCKNYAVWGTQPPRCSPHGGRMGQWVTDIPYRGEETDNGTK